MGGIPAAAGCQPALNSWPLTGFAPVGVQKQPVASKGSGLFGQAPNKKGPPIIPTGLLVVKRAALGAAARHPRLAPAAPRRTGCPVLLHDARNSHENHSLVPQRLAHPRPRSPLGSRPANRPGGARVRLRPAPAGRAPAGLRQSRRGTAAVSGRGRAGPAAATAPGGLRPGRARGASRGGTAGPGPGAGGCGRVRFSGSDAGRAGRGNGPGRTPGGRRPLAAPVLASHAPPPRRPAHAGAQPAGCLHPVQEQGGKVWEGAAPICRAHQPDLCRNPGPGHRAGRARSGRLPARFPGRRDRSPWPPARLLLDQGPAPNLQGNPQRPAGARLFVPVFGLAGAGLPVTALRTGRNPALRNRADPERIDVLAGV